ncbi:MAG: hypothetical protein ACOZBV_01885, partial [Pseudomonadota bacterium]
FDSHRHDRHTPFSKSWRQTRRPANIPASGAKRNLQKERYTTPEVIDLSKPACQDRIVGYEAFETWGIDAAKWLPA